MLIAVTRHDSSDETGIEPCQDLEFAQPCQGVCMMMCFSSAKRPNSLTTLVSFINSHLFTTISRSFTMEFQYRPLQPNSLRLLRPISIRHDLLAFDISHHPCEATAYTAVSYTWGDGEPTESVLINGQMFKVRVNLWSCLYYLGQAALSRSVPWTCLWVDAICIDQNNDNERNAQVRLMDEIYRNAMVVSVWLGLPPIPEFLREQLINYPLPIRTYENEGFDWSDSIEDLANRPYWKRFWVVQEYLLGRDLELYCGNSRVDWVFFKEILGRETGVRDYWQENVNYARSPSGSWAAWPLATGRHPDKHPEIHQSLYKLLIAHGGSQCKEPRDRVFALLGLVTLEERRLLERFLPDYTMPEDDVVLIALCHARLQTFHIEREPVDMKRLLLALGVESDSRQRRLVRRSEEYDYLGDIPPSAHQEWICDQETRNFNIESWGMISSLENDILDIRGLRVTTDTEDRGRKTRWVKRIVYVLGPMLFLMVVLKLYRPQTLATSVSFMLRTVVKLRKLTGQPQD
jgi:hypothetical protein